MANKDSWRDRLTVIAAEFPGKRKGLSLAARLNETALRDILERGSVPKLDSFLAICKAAHVDPATVLFGDEPQRIEIPVKGIASAGEGWTPAGDGTIDYLQFDLERDETLAIEVRGNSMAPVYRNGDFLICRKQGRAFDNLIGLDCAVLTNDGKGYVKILARGTRPGRFNLKSYNVVNKDIENVQLAWVAPIIWIKRTGA